MIEPFLALLDQHHRILLTTHENPDGDAIGSLVALARFLEGQGKDVRMVITPDLPPFLAWLDPDQTLERFDPQVRHHDLAQWPDLWLIVDASEPSRLGDLHPLFQASSASKASLDHHLKSSPGPFDLDFTDARASASAELVFEIISARLPRPLPLPIAQAIYTGLVDDTGSFRFSNATPKVHRMAADLIEDGADPALTYQNLYHQGRPQRLKLFGKAFASLRLLDGGRYASLTVTQADMQACEAAHEDLEGLVNKPLELKGVEVAALLSEREGGSIKVSLRSRSHVDVNAICKELGGGGHRQASGAKLDGPIEKAQTKVDDAVLTRLRKDGVLPE